MDDHEKKIIELWKQGLSTSKIAAQLNRSKNVICGKIFRMREKGIDLPPRAVVTKVRTASGKSKVTHRRLTTKQLSLDFIFDKKTEEKVKPVVVMKEKRPTNSRNIKFKHLTSDSCRYVINDGRPENFIFCGAPKERGAYCAEHAAICYNVPNYEQRRDIKRTAARFG